MRTGPAGRLSRALVGCHPRRWRERYREEMLDVLDQHQPTARTVVNLWVSAVSAQLSPAYRTDRLSLSRLERRGWVRPLASEERRRPYEITAAGQEILAEQVKTMQQIVQVARLRTATAWGA